jgi:dipeptidyl aminopeptidase/acylaminoacyl peptidase
MQRHTKQGSGLALAVFIMIVSACGIKPPVTATSTSTLPSKQAVTNTPASTITPISTATIEITLTPPFTPTPLGGGSGRLAYTLCSGTEFYDPEDYLGCEIHIINVDGSNPIQLTDDNTWDCCAVSSPDGTKLAFVSFLSSGSQISIMNVDGSNPTRLTNKVDHNNSPSWSPDGKKIVFSSDRNGHYEIYVVEIESGNLTQLTDSRSNFDPAWSPDGTKIVYRRETLDEGGIYVMNADGSHPIRLNDSISWADSPDWSPDGRKIGFSTSFGGDIDIYIMNPDGSNLIQLTDHPAADRPPVWSPDGRHIAFSSDRDGVPGPELYVMDSDGSNPTLLLPGAGTVSWLNQIQNPIVGNSDCTSGGTRLQAGASARVSQDTLTPNRVRSGPSTADKVTVLLHPGSVLKLLEGPVCADGLVFWKVENELIPGGVGWTAEGDGQEHWLEPYAP